MVYSQRPDRVASIDPLLYNLIRYTDSNFINNPEDRTSVIAYCFFINRALVSWNSKKQRIVFTSTIEAEYITLGYAARKAV